MITNTTETLISMAPRRVSKRIFDIAVSGVLVLVLLPVMMVIGLAVALTYRGNPLFLQHRNGLRGKQFQIYKFRTMPNPLVERESPLFVSRQDATIPSFSHLLRNTGLDELPQLFNILKGDMSLVGPRPQPVNHLAYYSERIPGYARRLEMLPGLTGLVQVSPLRHTTGALEDIAERVEYDLYYIDHWSFGLDLKILLKTLARMLGARRFVRRQSQPTVPSR